MVNRSFCDYCEKQITIENECEVEITLDGDAKDICSECADKIKKALDSIGKE